MESAEVSTACNTLDTLARLAHADQFEFIFKLKYGLVAKRCSLRSGLLIYWGMDGGVRTSSKRDINLRGGIYYDENY
jgi:hypothetical protein